jgi:hypothetical protein
MSPTLSGQTVSRLGLEYRSEALQLEHTCSYVAVTEAENKSAAVFCGRAVEGAQGLQTRVRIPVGARKLIYY